MRLMRSGHQRDLSMDFIILTEKHTSDDTTNVIGVWVRINIKKRNSLFTKNIADNDKYTFG